MSAQFVVSVILFAAARDAAGTAEIDILCDKPSTVDSVLTRAAEGNSGLHAFLSTDFLVAVDEEFAEPSTLIVKACEVAVLPPVSGG